MDTTLQSGIDPASFSAVISPKDDLFRYVNGPWIDTYRLPDDRSSYGSFNRLSENAEEQIRDILETDSEEASKSKALYHAFLDTDAIEAAGIEPIRADLIAIDEARTKEGLIDVLGRLSPFGGPDLFGFSVFGDMNHPETNVLYLGQGASDCPTKHTTAKTTMSRSVRSMCRWSRSSCATPATPTTRRRPRISPNGSSTSRLASPRTIGTM